MKKTNVVFIVADDLGYWALSSYGNKDAITPNIEKLSKEGMLFENFFCVSPICSPARASIFTGRIPSQHGILDWLNEWQNGATTEEYLKGQSTFVDALYKNGYSCGLSGKWHMGSSDKVHESFSFWYCHQKGGGPYYNAPVYKNKELIYEKEYITDRITEEGINFIEENVKKENPFFLALSYTAPHSPWGKNQHPEEILKLYENCNFESCPIEEDHPWKIYETFSGDLEQRKEVLKGYFASLTSMDKNIGKVIERLKKLNIYDDTLIIFTSDNGMNMGHHGFYGKGNGTSPLNMYDTSVKIPFILVQGEKYKGKKIENMLSHYDVRHTLLDYLNIKDELEEDVKFPGKSFKNILLGENKKDDESIVVYDEYGGVRMIRSKKYKYIHRYPDGPHEFYDLLKDRDEKNNLIDSEDYKNIIDQMRKKLMSWFNDHVNKDIDGAILPIYGGGQSGLAGKWGGYKDKENFKRYESDYIFTGDKKLEKRTIEISEKDKIQ
ncbi:MAG: sulfatase-like hydrolase/transferase [Cetobacterium sp.]|uniref:sulfatase-like hydrolase/transferase n=1 Tax=Cetobacterium sp. TaxID=2071632 RepID=UPI003F3AD28A